MSTICTIATTFAALIVAPAAALAQDVPAPAPIAPTATPPARTSPEAPPGPAAAPAPVAAPAAAAPAVEEDLEHQLALAETKAALHVVAAPPAERSGLTVEVSLGVAVMDVTVEGENGADDSGALIGGRTFSAGVGGYVAPSFVLGGRVVVGSATAFDPVLEIESSTTTVLIGPSLQLWAQDIVFIGGTAGVATAFDNHPGSAAMRGPGVEVRLGFAAPLTRGHGLVVAASVNPTLLDGLTVTSYGVQVGWQGF